MNNNPSNERHLSCDAQDMILRFMNNERREDLRLIPGMKKINDALPLNINEVSINGDERKIVVTFRQAVEDNVQIFEIVPEKVICIWRDVFNTELSKKTTPFAGSSVYEKLNELLVHFLDRAGTTVNSLRLDTFPRGIHFENLIRVFEVTSRAKDTDLSLFAAIQIDKLSILNSAPPANLQCEIMSTVKTIEIIVTDYFEQLYLLKASTRLKIRSYNEPLQAILDLIKKFTTASRPSEFVVTFEDNRAIRELVTKKILADEDYGWEEIQFEERSVPTSVACSLPSPKVLNLPNTKVQELSISCENGRASRATLVGENAVSTLVAGFSEKTIIDKLTVKGYCDKPLFPGKQILVFDLTLLSHEAFPACFFEQFVDQPFSSLTVSCRKTLENDRKLKRNAKNIIYIDETVQDEDHDEPPQKKFKASSS